MPFLMMELGRDVGLDIVEGWVGVPKHRQMCVSQRNTD
jgi:hypothetical protein